MSELQKENEIKEKLEKRFSGIVSNIQIPRKRRLWADVKPENLIEVVSFMRNELGFDHLSTIT
ncbi:MAG: hypothetical protein NTW04_00090, partial [Elusimicrobia bacterium]|nr:hypothetical protein [Elusimicrobiota bacterium]